MHDALDMCAAAVPLLKKQGISRLATIFLFFSLTGIVVFTWTGWRSVAAAGRNRRSAVIDYSGSKKVFGNRQQVC